MLDFGNCPDLGRDPSLILVSGQKNYFKTFKTAFTQNMEVLDRLETDKFYVERFLKIKLENSFNFNRRLSVTLFTKDVQEKNDF